MSDRKCPNKIYGVQFKDKVLHKYEIYHKGICQGWITAESPEQICQSYQWDIKDCIFKLIPLTMWDISGGTPIREIKDTRQRWGNEHFVF